MPKRSDPFMFCEALAKPLKTYEIKAVSGKCSECGEEFTGRPGKKTCGDKCSARRQRKKTVAAEKKRRLRKIHLGGREYKLLTSERAAAICQAWPGAEVSGKDIYLDGAL